jgi:hypothetical protein
MVPINGMGVNLTSTNALGIIALAEKTMNTAHRERETCLRGTPVYLRQYFCFFWFLEHIWVQEKEKSKQSSGGARIVYISAGGKWLCTHDWEFLLPLALPPDLPPVILNGRFGDEVGKGGRVGFVDGSRTSR